MMVDKACPVVLRSRQALEILAFEHPLAGLQLVKGSVEPGESTDVAAVRELVEEAGIQGRVVRHLGTWRSHITGHTWAFHECHVAQDLPDTWVHHAEDDGGHEFRFFWHPLVSEPSDAWHQIYKDALGFLRFNLATRLPLPLLA
ncbi:NUDIX hydrolase [Pseudomonas cerasi]|nr:NUDIX domain-containing protein [Pseudomonas cerasi]